jgi:myo-inositol-1-phosphate synthase
MKPVSIQPAKGKLGILLVGLGAVSTTVIAGVLAIRKGLAKTHRLAHADGHHSPSGKRTETASPRIKPRSSRWRASTIVCSAGGICSTTTATRLRKTAGVARGLAARIRFDRTSRRSKPMPAVFDRQYVKRPRRPNVKKGKNKKDLPIR